MTNHQSDISNTPWNTSSDGKVIITPSLQQKLRDNRLLTYKINLDSEEDDIPLEYKERNQELREDLLTHIFNGNIEYQGVPLHSRYGVILASKLLSNGGSLFYEPNGSLRGSSTRTPSNRILVTANQLVNCYYIRLNPETNRYEPTLIETDDVYNTHITVTLSIQNRMDIKQLKSKCKSSFSMYFLVEGMSSFNDLTLISRDDETTPSIIFNAIPMFSMGIGSPIQPPRTTLNLNGKELSQYLSQLSRKQAQDAQSRLLDKPPVVSSDLPKEGYQAIESLLHINKGLPPSNPLVIPPTKMSIASRLTTDQSDSSVEETINLSDGDLPLDE
jgi:hypothetical protein